MHELDDKDMKILETLKEDSSLSTQAIAKKTLIPITTVHNRITNLKRNKIILGYSLILDNTKLGKSIFSYILINVDNYSLRKNNVSVEDLARRIKQMEAVEEVTMVTGKSDILVKIGVKDVDELNEFITGKLRGIEGIENSSTMIVLKEI